MTKTFKILSSVAGIATIVQLSACDTGQYTQSKQFDRVHMSVTTKPDPLEVGMDAEVYVTMRLDRSAVNGCRMKFRQYMPGMEMSEDDLFRDLPEQSRSGIYKAKTGEFSMGGDWELEFIFDCHNVLPETKATFPYKLDWPE